MARSEYTATERQHCLTAVDAAAFSALLRAEWPTMRFLCADYWRVPGGIMEDQKPPNLFVPYVDSLGAPGEILYLAWVEPEDWRPAWADEPNREGVYRILNKPHLQFHFDTARLSDDDPVMDYGRIWAYYRRDDAEHRRFVNRVWRILARLATDELDWVDGETGEVKHNVRHGIWAGPDALRWCREDPRRRFWKYLRAPAAAEPSGT